ncbi:DUF4123 domain-containing protein [Xylophilus sp. GOD-11R]|uniref:DUF4123 domain-containing protein n=1 Tax=Xylophilus sp. GOD-11R TaxID=3089814 RepID=UPI00399A3FE5
MAVCNGVPALSFIQSPLDLNDLQRHLAAFTVAHTTDQLRMALRIADPIFLRVVVSALGPQAETCLRAGFAAWHLIGRDGHLTTWAGSAATSIAPPVPDGRWILSDAGFNAIVGSGEADALMCAAVRREPSLAERTRACELHRRTVALVTVLDRQKVESPAERSRLVRKALRFDDPLEGELWLKQNAGGMS